MAKVEEKGSAYGRDDHTQDGTVDLKGRPVLRSNTGRWTACSFIVGNGVIVKSIYKYVYMILNFSFCLKKKD